MPVAAVLLWSLHRSVHFDVFLAEMVMMAIAIFLPVTLMNYDILTEPTNLYLALGNLIADRQAVCLLGPALDLHYWGEVSHNNNEPRGSGGPLRSLLPAIEQMVRQMQPGDYADLTAQQKDALLRLLTDSFRHHGLAFALLEALKPVTDRSAMDGVARLAYGKTTTPEQQRIREAARQCLAAMQQESAKEQQPQMLLRASDADTVATSEILLRPAADTDLDTASDQLLRATHSDTQC